MRRRMLGDLKERLASFGLTLHEDKTRLIEFGRFAALPRQRRGERRPETFAFLGFTHYCGRTRDGRFIVKHKTQEQTPDAQADGVAPGSVAAHARATGRCNIAGSPAFCAATTATTACRTTIRRSTAFLREVRRIWLRCLRRRSQKSRRMGWAGVRDPDGTLPPACSTHHSPLGARADMTRVTLGKSRVRESRLPGSVRAKAKWLSYSTTTFTHKLDCLPLNGAEIVIREIDAEAEEGAP